MKPSEVWRRAKRIAQVMLAAIVFPAILVIQVIWLVLAVAEKKR